MFRESRISLGCSGHPELFLGFSGNPGSLWDALRILSFFWDALAIPDLPGILKESWISLWECWGLTAPHGRDSSSADHRISQKPGSKFHLEAFPGILSDGFERLKGSNYPSGRRSWGWLWKTQAATGGKGIFGIFWEFTCDSPAGMDQEIPWNSLSGRKNEPKFCKS